MINASSERNQLRDPEKLTVSLWLKKKYLQWINEQGSVRPQRDFAEFLGLDRVTFNRYYNGVRERMDFKNALQIANTLRDFELFDILGYPRPEGPELLLNGFPPDFQSAFVAALNAARSELVNKGITTSSPESRKIIREAFNKHGVDISWVDKESESR